MLFLSFLKSQAQIIITAKTYIKIIKSASSFSVYYFFLVLIHLFIHSDSRNFQYGRTSYMPSPITGSKKPDVTHAFYEGALSTCVVEYINKEYHCVVFIPSSRTEIMNSEEVNYGKELLASVADKFFLNSRYAPKEIQPVYLHGNYIRFRGYNNAHFFYIVITTRYIFLPAMNKSLHTSLQISISVIIWERPAQNS